jgi:hypothetical protein
MGSSENELEEGEENIKIDITIILGLWIQTCAKAPKNTFEDISNYLERQQNHLERQQML